tara:strand:- start:1136 stop:1264 length:129 start_codon:yes stop_codon:yes gene_type:complete
MNPYLLAFEPTEWYNEDYENWEEDDYRDQKDHYEALSVKYYS